MVIEAASRGAKHATAAASDAIREFNCLTQAVGASPQRRRYFTNTPGRNSSCLLVRAGQGKMRPLRRSVAKRGGGVVSVRQEV